ncbi:MAG: type II transport protein [Desulfobacterales bacterium]|jgi:type IV fimbrial biogenesis protein FimT|nr:type II transport protein [Desulfobacteraceae bacterium]MBT7696180.1 type II transport protein [Desulfobacterales bacterium]
MLRSEAGFTLVELIIVIAIISVVIVIAVPNIVVWRQNAEIRGAARDVYSYFQKAKIEAIKRKTFCTITFSQEGFVIYADSDKDLVQDGGEYVIAGISLSDYGGVSLDTSQGNGDGLTFSNPNNGIAFSSSGIPRSSGGFGSGSVYLKHNNNKTARVIVSSSGNIRIE